MSPGLLFALSALAVGSALGAAAWVRRRDPPTRAGKALVVVLVAGLAVGTGTHLENLLRAGWVPRPELPLACNAFWSALVLVDPGVAVVLLLRPRVGVWAVLALISADLAVNLCVLGLTGPVAAQLAFAGLAVVATLVIRRDP